MIKITKITGKKEILNRIDRMQSLVYNSAEVSLRQGAYVLRDKAIANVRNWAKQPGFSLKGGSIVNSEIWGIEPKSNLEIELTCNSDHAAVVEFGGTLTGTSMVVSKGKGGFPIGKQQHGQASFGEDGKPIIRRKFDIQQPMGYLGSALESSKGEMLDKIGGSLNRTIMGII